MLASALLVATALAPPAATGADARDLQALLPAEAAVAPWKASGPATRYDRATLSNFIDGAAELYLKYGFANAITQEYVRGDDSVLCAIYEMTDSRAASGIFSNGLSPQKTRLPIGDGAARAGFQLTFWQGRYYVVVETFSTGPEADRLLDTFARVISANIGRETSERLQATRNT